MFFTSRLKLCGSSGFKVVYRSCERHALFDLASHALRKRLDTTRSDSRRGSPRVQPRSAIIFFEPQPAGVCATTGGIPVVPLPSSAFLLLLRDLEVDGMNVKPLPPEISGSTTVGVAQELCKWIRRPNLSRGESYRCVNPCVDGPAPLEIVMKQSKPRGAFILAAGSTFIPEKPVNGWMNLLYSVDKGAKCIVEKWIFENVDLLRAEMIERLLYIQVYAKANKAQRLGFLSGGRIRTCWGLQH